MTRLASFERGLAVVETALNLVAVSIIALVMLWVVANVVARYVFDFPLYGHLESTEMAMAALVFLGGAYTHRTNGHVRMELLVRRFPPRVFHLAEGASNLLALAILLVITFYSWKFTVLAFRYGDVSPTAYFPLWPAKLMIPLGMVVLNVRCALLVVRHLARAARPAEKRRFST